MNNKLKTLQAILDNANFDFCRVQDYDFTQCDAMDESNSGGRLGLGGLHFGLVLGHSFNF